MMTASIPPAAWAARSTAASAAEKPTGRGTGWRDGDGPDWLAWPDGVVSGRPDRSMAVRPQRTRAAVAEAAKGAEPVMTRQLAGLGPGTGPGVPGWSKTGPKRALAPPVERCPASAGPRTTGTRVSREAAKSAVCWVRTASRMRGGETTDSSGPAEKMTRDRKS